MAQEEYTTKIKIEADTAGGEKAVKSFEDVEKKAVGLQKAVSGVTKAVRLMRGALMGFGVVGLFTSLIGAVEGLRKKFGETSIDADKLRIAAEKAADTKRVEKLTAAYDNLKNSIDAAAKARQRANELEDMEKTATREQEDIDAQAAKDAEIAALDPNDRYYEQKKAQIEAKYSAQAANRAAQRKVEDAETSAARSAAEAETKAGEANQKRALLIDDRAQLDILKERRARALVESAGGNDITGGEQAWTDFTRLFGMNGGWRKFGSYTTEEGDAKRKEAEDKAKALEAEIKAKEKDIAEKERKIAELEEEAQYLSNKSVIQSRMAENAKDAASVTRAAGYRSDATAAAGLSGQIEKENDAKRAAALLEEQKIKYEQQIAAQNQRKFDARWNVAQAQSALTEAQGTGNRRAISSAQQRINAANQAADEAYASADRMIENFTQKLRQLISFQNKVNNELERNNSQRLFNQAEALTTN